VEIRVDHKGPSPSTTHAIHEPLLTSLGLAVIDETRFVSGSIEKHVLGGSGTYCTIGARLFTPANVEAAQLRFNGRYTSDALVSWIARAGEDFPLAFEQLISSWGIDFHLSKAPGGKSTRGLLIYTDST
jgi:hypothetical protein